MSDERTYEFSGEYERNLFESRYQDRGEPDWLALFERVASSVAPDYEIRQKYINAMTSGAWMPSSPQLWNFGSERHSARAGSSCYTLRVEDNLESFEQADIDARKIYVASGGAGFLFDDCRPKGVGIKHSVSACVGVMGFGGPLRRLESRTGYITNGGRERGAMMAQLSITHPDAIEFICAKRPTWIGRGEPDKSRGFDWQLPLQNCNMSIRLNDCFMNAVIGDKDWVFSWFGGKSPYPHETVVDLERLDPVLIEYQEHGNINIRNVAEGITEYKRGFVITTWEALKENLKPNPRNFKDTDYGFFHNHVLETVVKNFHGKIKAREVWHVICTMAWTSGDPGVVFSDTYERWNPVPSEGIRLSNPCAEYVNPPGGSCLLVSQNLRYLAEKCMSKYDPDEYTDEAALVAIEEDFYDWIMASSALACQYINDALNHCRAPVDYIEETTRERVRTVGQGLMGLAEAMALFGYKYNQEDGLEFAERCMDEICISAWEQSFKLHRSDRHRYPSPKAWDPERMQEIFMMRANDSTRNTPRWMALIAKIAKGHRATNTTVTSVAPTGSISMIVGWMMSHNLGEPRTVTSGCEPPFAIHTARKDNSGETTTSHDLADTGLMITASEVTPKQHVLMQAAVAKFTCMSVSKTCNLPENAKIDDIANVYMTAWESGVPATALYRDNSKPFSVLTGLAECPSGECEVTPRSENDAS